MMRWILMGAAILLNVGGHLALKGGMNRLGAIGPTALLSDFGRVFTTPLVLVGLVSYVASVGFYMTVLSRENLSFAYPLLMSVAYVFVVAASFFLFKEPFGSLKWIGAAAILVGVWLVSMGD
jgi:multidrug transporter EmrE-like cation transporter